MQNSFRSCALAGCASIMVGGCAAHQNAAPEYRLSSTAPAPVAGSSMLQRGRAQLDAGLDALAIESFRAEIRRNPESADAYNGLAVAYGRIGREDLAQRYFETALAKDPQNPKAQNNLARLTGEVVHSVRVAAVNTLPANEEPVGVSKLAEVVDPIAALIEQVEMPVLALAEAEPSTGSPMVMPEALTKTGVLSTRFAIAPASMTVKKADSISSLQPKPGLPPELPRPSVPLGTFPADYRTTGARLERVSLGEVHLITRPTPKLPASLPEKPDFESFGDRLATWLPGSVAEEQGGNAHGLVESRVIMAAIERASQGRALAQSAIPAAPKLPEFAYLFFNDHDDVVAV